MTDPVLPPILIVRQAAFGYRGRPIVVADALALHPGHCLGVFGPNGAGKTTLVRGITGLLPPLAGEVHRHAPPLAARGHGAGAPDYAAPAARSLRIGYMPQSRSIDPYWPMTALDAASLASSAYARLGRVSAVARRAVLDGMTRLGVRDLAARPFARLSGGQQQRVLLAGALAPRPDLLVLDEPADGLDIASRRALAEVLRSLTAGGLSALLISHDVEDLLALADQIAWLHPGLEAGLPSTVELLTPVAFESRFLDLRNAKGASQTAT